VRLFLALELEPAVRDCVGSVRSRWPSGSADVRWTEPENFHLTVVFLGEQDPVALPGIQEACDTVASETSPFRIEFAGASGFPKHGPLRTLFVPLVVGADAWRELVERAEPWFVPMGVARNGGLVPHLTVGRVKSGGDDPELRAGLESLSGVSFGGHDVVGMSLVHSVLDRSGATYRTVSEHRFGGPVAGETA
jgi:2'-5' RNA ligase